MRILEANRRALAGQSFKVTLEPKAHTYIDEKGRRLPSVSELIKLFFSHPGSENFLKKYEKQRVIGTYVHTATVLQEKGTLNVSILHEGLKPYLVAHRHFLDNNAIGYKAKDFRSEISLGAPSMFAGTLDRVSEAMIVDYKTGARTEQVRYQMNAYYALQFLLDGIDRELYAVYLGSDEKYSVDKIEKDEKIVKEIIYAATLWHTRIRITKKEDVWEAI